MTTEDCRFPLYKMTEADTFEALRRSTLCDIVHDIEANTSPVDWPLYATEMRAAGEVGGTAVPTAFLTRILEHHGWNFDEFRTEVIKKYAIRRRYL